MKNFKSKCLLDKSNAGFIAQPSQLERMCKLYLLPTPSACASRVAFAQTLLDLLSALQLHCDFYFLFNHSNHQF